MGVALLVRCEDHLPHLVDVTGTDGRWRGGRMAFVRRCAPTAARCCQCRTWLLFPSTISSSLSSWGHSPVQYKFLTYRRAEGLFFLEQHV